MDRIYDGIDRSGIKSLASVLMVDGWTLIEMDIVLEASFEKKGDKNGEIRKGSEQVGPQGDAPQKARNLEIRKRWQSWDGKEPKASNRHRPFRGAQERRQGAAKEIQLKPC